MSHMPIAAKLAWILVMLLFSTVVTLTTFILTKSTGQTSVKALLLSVPAFPASMALCVGLAAVL